MGLLYGFLKGDIRSLETIAHVGSRSKEVAERLGSRAYLADQIHCN